MMTIALTIGDINGIGPEVALKAVRDFSLPNDVRLALIGPYDAWRYWAECVELPLDQFTFLGRDDFFLPNSQKYFILAPGQIDPVRIEVGAATEFSGRIAAQSITLATKLALGKVVDAIVTAPISKAALHLAGVAFPGHTEMLASLSGSGRPVMLLLAGDFRVAVATTHIPLRNVASALTAETIMEVVTVLDSELKGRFGIKNPRIAATGLNPHAGEDGTLGDEEQKLLIPTLAQLRRHGAQVEGPFPADALFSRISAAQNFDAYLAMYHDQGLIPVKMQSKGKGVNYTCGLPFVRTSPDHGTAFEIAGKNIADAASTMEALRFAIEIARKCQAR
ncbi:MAG: 4-hydroxythreonine-4-phosphate dehydrogenase PdxA [Deferribacteres bacterium]|nr:4-hydroxythreonine-4-phosphate dehydrogenase PdxA [candidate division KSB1 bacterium]MCB9511908.1 4-hydroxythreonine-4-phosphate dehydrogenase PdxA [Deferribacteres bacterium]